MAQPPERPPDAQRKPNVWTLVTLGSTLAGAVVAGLVIGLVLDATLDSGPTWTLVGLGVGVVAGGWGFWLQIKPFVKSGP